MRIKRNQIFVMMFTVALMLISACDNSDNGKLEFEYPLKVGNRWDFERHYVLLDSETQDTLVAIRGTGFTEVTGIQTLLDTLEAYCVYGQINDFIIKNGLAANSPDSVTAQGRSYYVNFEDGLYLIGYVSGGGTLFLPRPIKSDVMQFPIFTHGLFPDPLTRIIPGITSGQHRVRLDSIYIEEPFAKCLHYPLSVDAEWRYRENEELGWTLDRSVLAETRASVPRGDFRCFEIQTNYTFSATPIAEEIEFIDYVGQRGLLKREMHFLRMPTIMVGGWPDTLDMHDNYQLVHYQIR